MCEPELNLNSTEQSKMAGFCGHGTEVMGFKKQIPCGPALQQSTLHERKTLSKQLVRSWCRNSTLSHSWNKSAYEDEISYVNGNMTAICITNNSWLFLSS
jgi:hypothetical protein